MNQTRALSSRKTPLQRQAPRALVLTRKDVKRVELETVAHVEGGATVTLLIGTKESK
jgi:hypothetical protein